MRQLNFSASSKWENIWAAESLKKKHPSVTRRQNRLNVVRNWSLHWERAVADCLATFETWPPLVNFHKAEWIRWQWMDLFLKKRASDILEAGKNGNWGNKRPATDFGDRVGKEARSNLPELPNTIFTVIIHWVSNVKDMVMPPNSSNPRIQMWGTGRSWVISSTKMAARKSHTFSDQCWSAP